MAYVRVPDPLLDVNKPGRSTDWKQIRDNQDFFNTSIETLNRKAITTDQDIREHFMGTVIDLPIAGSFGTWIDESVTGTVVLTRTTPSHWAVFSATGTGQSACLAATTRRQRVQKAEAYVAYCECRLKITGASNVGSYRFGWNDNALAGTAIINDISDSVVVENDGASLDWVFITGNGGAFTTHTVTTTNTAYHILRMEFTCSATAGSRKVECYFDDVLQATLATDANMPTALLRPFVGTNPSAAVACSMEVDWIEFGFLTKPTAA